MKIKEFISKYAKLYMIISIITLISTVGVTYAYYSAVVSNNTDVTGQAGGGTAPTLSVDLVSKEAVGKLVPINMDEATLTRAASATTKCVDHNGYSSCQIYSVTVTNNSDIAQSYNITLTNLYGENTPNVDAVSMGTSDSSVTDASSIKGKGSICTTNSVGNGETTNTCYFMVLIKNLDTVQRDSGTFSGTVTATSTTGDEIKASFGDNNPTLIEHITNLYVENYDSTKNVQFAGNTGMNYYAPNARLMNDGLDSTGAMVDEASAVNGTAGNIRYYGADDSNLKNHIYFNCSDYSNQSSSTCETWRIIGIVDGKVKLIRHESIGAYPYDEEGYNNWKTSSLQNIINNGAYYGELETKNNKTFELISNSTWYINEITNSYMYANAAYKLERTGNRTWPGKIALAYPSDYGYATDLHLCTALIDEYFGEGCNTTNWLANVFTIDGNWLITPNSESSGQMWVVYSLDVVYKSIYFSAEYEVLPTLYLDPTLSIDSNTDGSSNNPYKLIVS